MPNAIDLQAEEYEAVPLPPPLGGVNSSAPASDIADNQLVSAANLVIQDGVVRQRQGYETVIGGALAAPPLELAEFLPVVGAAKLVAGTTTGFAVYDTAANAWSDNTGFAVRTGNTTPWFVPMQTDTAGLLLLSGNGVEGLAGWSGGGNWSVLSTAVLGGCGVVWHGHLLQGDVSTPLDGRVRMRVQWSALGNPQVYTGTASTGTVNLLDENASNVQCFAPMRTTLLAYKEVGVHALGYKGHPFYFTQGLLHGKLTCISRRAVAPVQDGTRHLVVTLENIVMWDGSNVERIGDPIRAQFFRELNWDQRSKVWAMYWPSTEEVGIGIPTVGSAHVNKLWIYNLRYNSWWPQGVGFIASREANLVFSPPRVLVASLFDTRVYQMYSGLRDGVGVATITSHLQTKAFDFGSPSAQKRLKRVTGLFGTGTAATATIQLERAAADNVLFLSTCFDAPVSVVARAENMETAFDKQVSGKWLSFRLSHSAANATVAVHRLSPYIQGRSTRRQKRE